MPHELRERDREGGKGKEEARGTATESGVTLGQTSKHKQMSFQLRCSTMVVCQCPERRRGQERKDSIFDISLRHKILSVCHSHPPLVSSSCSLLLSGVQGAVLVSDVILLSRSLLAPYTMNQEPHD
jgi:hypothetical protein